MDGRIASGRAIDDVARDTDDGEPRSWGCGGQPPLETLAHRVLAGPIGIGEPFVDDRDIAVLALFVSGEGAAGDERNSVRSKKIPVHPRDGNGLPETGPGRVLDAGRAPITIGLERKIAGNRRGADPGQRAQPLFERAIKPSRACRVAVAGQRQPHLRAQHVGGADARCTS